MVIAFVFYYPMSSIIVEVNRFLLQASRQLRCFNPKRTMAKKSLDLIMQTIIVLAKKEPEYADLRVPMQSLLPPV